MLRIARRDALRARGRSALVVLLIALPVLGVTALDTLIRTANVSAAEGLERQLGRSQALVAWTGVTLPVLQSPGLSRVGYPGAAPQVPRPDESVLLAGLPAGSRLLAVRAGTLELRTADGLARPQAVELDVADPATTGLYRLEDGRVPVSPDEVSVSPRLATRGFPVGSALELADGSRRTVVGTVTDPKDLGANLVLGLPGALGLTEPPSGWLVVGPARVTWPDVQRLNTLGLTVLSRSVVLDPPPADEVPLEVQATDGGTGAVDATVLGLVVAMTLLEVVLLAGPALAVGARRQRRALALLAATGGSRRHVTGVVLAGGLVLGLAAAAVGVLAGVATAAASRSLVQRVTDTAFGPLDVAPRDLLVVAAFAVVSALLAALAPALAAARADVVAVLAGRRGQSRPSWGLPVAGLLLFSGGTAVAVWGVLAQSTELSIALAAIATVLGVVLLSPFVVGLAGHLDRFLPLPARLAVRDAARSRGRTAPAVAAVAAVVAGVVALGVGAASDGAQAEATYQPQGPYGEAVVRAYGQDALRPELNQELQRALPAAEVVEVRGELQPSISDGEIRVLEVCRPGDAQADYCPSLVGSYGSQVLVGVGALDLVAVDPDERAAAQDVLAAGGVVVFSTSPLTESTVVVRTVAENVGAGVEATRMYDNSVEFPAARLSADDYAPALLVTSESAAAQLDLDVGPVGLVTRGAALDTAAEDQAREAVTAVDDRASLYVERGHRDDALRVVLLLLGSVGGLLVLGGTLTATLLALSDARPDFATLAAIGAAARLRRTMAACYAGAIGLLGALLGVIAGLVPGVAVSFPLTRTVPSTTELALLDPHYYLAIPWLLLAGVVIGVPLLAAIGVGLLTRSRLPMTRQIL